MTEKPDPLLVRLARRLDRALPWGRLDELEATLREVNAAIPKLVERARREGLDAGLKARSAALDARMKALEDLTERAIRELPKTKLTRDIALDFDAWKKAR